MHRNTKIVATIGPSSRDETTLRELLMAGVNVARLNFSHGTHAEHQEVIQRLRKVSAELKRPICILLDMQGPKIRTGTLASGQVEITAGQTLTLTTRSVPGSEQLVPVDFANLPHCVQPGGKILLDDGNLELAVTAVSEDQVETRVILGGTLKSHKGINLPGACLDIAGFTEKDAEDLAFGMANGVDAIAVSFVRSVHDIQQVREAITRLEPGQINAPIIIAKLERPEALDNLEGIVAAADGVMVARGDLGVEVPPETVPIAQKRIIQCANEQGKIVITATQMLDSMIHNPRPTRAEASDVANAIFDGTDAVMLSGETASGQYPVKAVETMDAIVCQAEAHLADWGHWQGSVRPESAGHEGQDDAHFVTLAARELAHDRNVAAIACFTKSGRTALLMSKARPRVPIMAFTASPRIYQRMMLYWGVSAYQIPHARNMGEMLANLEAILMEARSVEAGQQVVLICGYPVEEVRPPNMALLHTVGTA